MAYRHWCGECGFKTAWLSEPRGKEMQFQHYIKRHPGVPPGGSVEIHRGRHGGILCCLAVVGLLFLLLILLT